MVNDVSDGWLHTIEIPSCRCLVADGSSASSLQRMQATENREDSLQRILLLEDILKQLQLGYIISDTM